MRDIMTTRWGRHGSAVRQQVGTELIARCIHCRRRFTRPRRWNQYRKTETTRRRRRRRWWGKRRRRRRR
jgi:hypothetical protein